MYPNGEQERIRERFRSLRRDEEPLAPPFERTWRAADARRKRSRADHRLRFGLAASLCACTAALALLLSVQPPADPPTPARASDGAVAEPARAPLAPAPFPDEQQATQPAEPIDPAPRLVAAPPIPEQKVNRPIKGTRRQKASPNTSCAEC
jgi:hypothetical protein